MTDTMSRRAWIASLTQSCVAGLALIVPLPPRARASEMGPLIVYKDPSCGCCTKWVAHLRAAGLRPAVQDRSDMAAIKDSLGIPSALRSCHTAVAGTYIIEGHVPAADLKRLLATTPRGIVGLAVPDMPAGSPGMELPDRAGRYDVIAFAADGATKLFARH